MEMITTARGVYAHSPRYYYLKRSISYEKRQKKYLPTDEKREYKTDRMSRNEKLLLILFQ